MVKYMDKIRTTLLIIDDVYDVLYEAVSVQYIDYEFLTIRSQSINSQFST